jgi:hypothetical protein
MEPLPGSPAIDRGVNLLVPPTDQRGRLRPVNTVDVGAVEVQVPGMAGRHVFYNNSSFDGGDAAAGAADDGARASDKTAFVAGAGIAAFENVTGYSKGLNGVFVDIADPPEGVPLTADDFSFRSSRTEPGGASAPEDGPLPVSVSVRRGEGANGSDRFTLVWRDYDPADASGTPRAVANGWLEVTVRANARTGLARDDVFQFGNLVGETGPGFRVNALDLGAAKRALNATGTLAATTDINRDGRTNALDLGLIKRSLNRTLSAPIPAPGVGPVRATLFGDEPSDGKGHLIDAIP